MHSPTSNWAIGKRFPKRAPIQKHCGIASLWFGLSCLVLVGPLVGTTKAQEPAVTEWTRAGVPLKFLTELHFGGPNRADIPSVSYTGQNMIGRIDGGTASGPLITGEVLPVGEDWALARPDGTLEINVRTIVQTKDGGFIKIRYEGRWRGSPETRQKILSGQDVDPREYYLRVTPYFETTSKQYEWLNSIVAIGYGKVDKGAGVTVRIYQVQ